VQAERGSRSIQDSLLRPHLLSYWAVVVLFSGRNEAAPSWTNFQAHFRFLSARLSIIFPSSNPSPSIAYRASLGWFHPEGLCPHATVSTTLPHCSDEKKKVSASCYIWLGSRSSNRSYLFWLLRLRATGKESRREPGQTGPSYYCEGRISKESHPNLIRWFRLDRLKRLNL